MDDRWLACTSQLEAEVSPQLYKTWIKPLTFLGYDESEHVLRLGVPNQFKLNWVRTQFGGRIAELAVHLIDPRVSVRFEVCSPQAVARLRPAGTVHAADGLSGLRSVAQPRLGSHPFAGLAHLAARARQPDAEGIAIDVQHQAAAVETLGRGRAAHSARDAGLDLPGVTRARGLATAPYRT